MLDDNALEELNAAIPRVVWTGPGLLRDARDRYTVHMWEEIDHPRVGTYYRHADSWDGRPRPATEEEIEWLPIVRDNYRPPHETCARCQKVAYLEEHHWAPRHLFIDPDSWPTSRLCQPCHAEWHRIVTPKMHLKRAQ